MKRLVPLVRIELGAFSDTSGGYLILTDVWIDDADGNLFGMIESKATTVDHIAINFHATCAGVKIQTRTAAKPTGEPHVEQSVLPLDVNDYRG